MNVYKAIAFAKDKLMRKADKSGICENFGAYEVRRIREQYDPMLNGSIGTKEMNRQLAAISEFENWCATYTG